MMGTWIQQIAQSWLVYRLTGSPFLLGLTAFSSQFPILVLAPLARSAQRPLRPQASARASRRASSCSRPRRWQPSL